MSRSSDRARRRRACALPKDVIADATAVVAAMTVQQRLALGDEVFVDQPNLLASVLVQQRMGASLPQIDVLLNLLFVAHQAMKQSGLRWPLITEATQDRCLQHLTGRLRFAHGLAPRQFQQAVLDAIDEHREPYLLAYVYAHLREHGWLTVDTEAQKYLVLAALNLVDCIADTAPPHEPPDSHGAAR